MGPAPFFAVTGTNDGVLSEGPVRGGDENYCLLVEVVYSLPQRIDGPNIQPVLYSTVAC